MPLRNEHTSAFSRFDLTLLIVNIIGAIIYLYAASPSWATPEERAQGIHSVAGEPVVWAVRALPILTSPSKERKNLFSYGASVLCSAWIRPQQDRSSGAKRRVVWRWRLCWAQWHL